MTLPNATAERHVGLLLADINRLVLMTVLKRVPMPDLNIDMGDMTKELGNVTQSAGEVIKGAGEAVDTTRKSILGAIKDKAKNVK